MLKEVENIVKDYADKIVLAAKNNLADKELSGGELYNSLKSNVNTTDDDIVVTFSATDYAKFYDEGVQGANPSKMPSGSKIRFNQAPQSQYRFGTGSGKKGGLRAAIDKWVLTKPGLQESTRDDLGRFIKRKSMVFLISRSIYLTGLKPSYFFTKPFDFYTKNLEKDLEEALEKDITIALNQYDQSNEITITIR